MRRLRAAWEIQSADQTNSRAIKDLTKALQTLFSRLASAPNIPLDSRRALQAFVTDYCDNFDPDESRRANGELQQFFERHVNDSSQKLGAFMGVLRELQPLIIHDDDLLSWWQLVAKRILTQQESTLEALEDAYQFTSGCLNFEPVLEQADATVGESLLCEHIFHDLLDVCSTSIHTKYNDDNDPSAPANVWSAPDLQAKLFAFGRQQPKAFFKGVDDLITTSTSRSQGLALLIAFLQHEAPHIYLVLETPLIKHLVTSLLNDTLLETLSAALIALIMFMPHIPIGLKEYLPQLFLIYSRLLCWERFDPASNDMQRALVMDDRVFGNLEAFTDVRDVGFDEKWDTSRAIPGINKKSSPDVSTYFTYLYGMYPLNFSAYIRKPRRYLKNVEFAGAHEFDLDPTIIRARSEKFRRLHFMHSNFFNMTVEEELADPKWLKADPADTVAACHALCISLAPPIPRSTTPLPQSTNVSAETPRMSHLQPEATLPIDIPIEIKASDSTDQLSISLPDEDCDRDSMCTGLDSGMTMYTRENGLHAPYPQFPVQAQPPIMSNEPHEGLAYLRSEISSLRNELNFEKWHKAQYSQHIGQLMRKNVKDATAEAETLNLLNANRALKQQLEQLRSAREATIKDSFLTRKQSSNLESNLTERINKLKRDQELWQAETDELRQLRLETKQYRELLVETEARELNKTYRLEIATRELGNMGKFQEQLLAMQKRLRSYEYRDFEFQRTTRDHQILENECEALKLKVIHLTEDRERMSHLYRRSILELKNLWGQIMLSETAALPSSVVTPSNAIQKALMDSQTNFARLKLSYTRLLKRYAELEIELDTMYARVGALTDKDGTSVDLLRLTHIDRIPDASLGSTIHPGYLEADGHDFDVPLAIDKSTHVFSSSDPTNGKSYLDVGDPIIPSMDSNVATVSKPTGLMWLPKNSRSMKKENPRRVQGSTDIEKAFFFASEVPESAAQSEDESLDVDMKESHDNRAATRIVPTSSFHLPSRGSSKSLKTKDTTKVEGRSVRSGAFRGLKNIL